MRKNTEPNISVFFFIGDIRNNSVDFALHNVKEIPEVGDEFNYQGEGYEVLSVDETFYNAIDVLVKSI